MRILFLMLITVFFVVQCSCMLAQNKLQPPCDIAVIEKAKTAMLCLQRYSWELGTAMQAMLEIGDSTAPVIMARESDQRSTPDGRLSMVGFDFNIADTGVNDPVVPAAYKITGDKIYLIAAKAQYEYLKKVESKNEYGVIYHNNKSKVIFSDNMFMVALFGVQMGDFDEAIAQNEGIRRVLWNDDEKLFHHIRTEKTGEFRDKSFWSGGNGWCAATMVQITNILPKERTIDKQKLIGYYTNLLNGCIANFLPSGLKYDKITIPNFEETTLHCMLAYSIYTGIKTGWLNDFYLAAAEKMRMAVYANIDNYNLMQKASKAPRFNSPGTSTEGQAFFLMMEGALRKL